MFVGVLYRSESLQEIQSGGQLALWSENFDNQITDENDIEEKTIEHFSQCINWTSLHDALAIFFMKHGPICSTGDVKKILKKFEKDGRIEILRNPKTTDQGRPAVFMSEGKGKTVSVRWIG